MFTRREKSETTSRELSTASSRMYNKTQKRLDECIFEPVKRAVAMGDDRFEVSKKPEKR